MDYLTQMLKVDMLNQTWPYIWPFYSLTFFHTMCISTQKSQVLNLKKKEEIQWGTTNRQYKSCDKEEKRRRKGDKNEGNKNKNKIIALDCKLFSSQF